MKKAVALIIALGLALMPMLCAAAEDTAPKAATLAADGSASVTLSPDMAMINVGVLTEDASLTVAQQKNAELMTSLIAAISSSGVPDADVSTDSYYVNPMYDYQYGKLGEERVLKGYQVENRLSVTLRDLGKVGATLDAFIAAGANTVYGLNFDSSERAAAYDKALTAAVSEASRKAGLMSAACGMELGGLVSITENGGGMYYDGITAKASFDMAGNTILPGVLTVSASVQMVYEIK